MRLMLDLFCGEGLAAWGYWRSGCFDDIDGIDIVSEMRSRYSFNFTSSNAMQVNYEQLARYSFIHASPPCQAYSKITPDKSKHVRLIAATHLMLYASGIPYVIENVEGSGQELRPNLVMNGLYFGLPSARKRYFHVSTLKENIVMVGKGEAELSPQGETLNRKELIRAMGLEMIPEYQVSRLTIRGIEQGIPPVFTQTIARMIFPQMTIG